MEYTDCLGRTRQCMKKDLEFLKAKDSDLKEAVEKKKNTENNYVDKAEEKVADEEILTEDKKELMHNDTRREQLRKQWEKEEEEIMKKTSVHYQDVLFSGTYIFLILYLQIEIIIEFVKLTIMLLIFLEARSHGVGYYGFSKNEEQRLQQQESLRKLREETQTQQKKSEEVRAMREKQLAERAKAARNRKRARMGLPPEEDGNWNCF